MKNLKKYIDFIVALATAISFIGVSICLWAIVILIAFHCAFDWFSWKILIVGGLPILLYLIMQANTLSYFIIYNEDYCNRIEKWVCRHSTTFLVAVSLGYVNVFLLNICYIRKIYQKSILIYYNKSLTMKSLLAMIPIVNVLVYMDYVVWLKDRKMLDIDYRDLMSYFFRGQMMTTIIRTLYKEKHGKS